MCRTRGRVWRPATCLGALNKCQSLGKSPRGTIYDRITRNLRVPVTSQPPLTIATLLKREVRPVVLVGAGASARSGIPLTDELVSEIAKWGYCKTHARDMDDPTLMRSDWWPWLTRQSWFRHDSQLSQHYPRAVEAILQPREDRKAFFQRVLNPGVPVSRGYQILAELLARRVLRTVLTTNFDSLLAQQCRSVAAVYQITEIKTPDDFRRFSTNPQYPQVIYVHGSVEHYTDQNIEQETQRLNPALIDLLRPLLRDHPLVVIGYRGAEPSVMRHLLIEQAGQCDYYKHGIYWCQRGEREPSPDSSLAELARAVGGNFQFVNIQGFDELLEDLNTALPDLLAAAPSDGGTPVQNAGAIRTEVHDLQPASVKLNDLDPALLRAKLLAYCEASRLPKPVLTDDAGLTGAMLERSLVCRQHGTYLPTQGGQLLFAKEAVNQLPSAEIEVRIVGEPAWVDEIFERAKAPSASATAPAVEEVVRLRGNLWVQLEIASTLLSRINRPFRLKGSTSHDAYPYPPLALKEILTNLIAHRDYAVTAVSAIEITRQRIRFSNPGGLVDHVKAQLRTRELQSAIEQSARGIKGYRNPVIADFFFSAGAMEKEGSGLPDVVNEAANNLNELNFGPTNDNRSFVVVLHSRPEALAVDPTTRTARPLQGELRYSPNLLSILHWPERIWKIATIAKMAEIATTRHKGAPPFCVLRDWIWTFADPGSPSSAPLLAVGLAEEIHQVPTSELLRDPSSAWTVPHLLNSAMEGHLSQIGLRIKLEGTRLRAYYPSIEGSPREITYRGLFKQATRTVAKPILSRSTQKVIFWEHKAVGLRFERFADNWCLALLPGYVFTVDGDHTLIDSERIGPLSTRRAARDYNPSVLHDLVFWSRILAQRSESTFRISLDANIESATALELTAVVPTVVFQETPTTSNSSLAPTEMPEAELLEFQAEIERLLDESATSDENLLTDDT